MYKDKPYNYPTSGRAGFRKRYLAYFGVVLVILFWFFGGKTRDRPLLREAAGKGLWDSISSSTSKTKATDWASRQEQVKKAMQLSWTGYEKYAWGYDEYHPVSKTGRHMVPPTGLGWIIVDALDTMMLMNMTTELKHARDWIRTTLTYDLDHDVNTFETTIRMLGGFLSAHYLQTEFPEMCPVDLGAGGEDLYIEKAVDLATRLLGAYESPSGIPYASVNLHSMRGIRSHADGGASSLAEATSVQLEMKYLAHLTGEKHYWEAAEKVMEVIDKTGEKDGLKGIFVSPTTGLSTSHNVRLGSRGDSYYEYLIKQYLQTSKKEPIYLDMWDEALGGMKKHLVTYSEPSKFTVLGERPSGLDGPLSPKMDHLVCFLPGTIALAATDGQTLAQAKQKTTWTAENQQNIDFAKELLKTCIGMYKVTQTGLAPEISYFKIADPPIMMNSLTTLPSSPKTFDPSADAAWHEDYEIHLLDRHNLQRPETVESLFYLWRITGEEYYRQVGWEIFEAFVKHTTVPDGAGFSSIGNVEEIPPPTRDNMESFWPAETLKYLYLLFGPDDVLPLDKIVFNTEAHPFPNFDLGKLFTTGWTREKKTGTTSSVQPSETAS